LEERGGGGRAPGKFDPERISKAMGVAGGRSLGRRGGEGGILVRGGKVLKKDFQNSYAKGLQGGKPPLLSRTRLPKPELKKRL